MAEWGRVVAGECPKDSAGCKVAAKYGDKCWNESDDKEAECAARRVGILLVDTRQREEIALG